MSDIAYNEASEEDRQHFMKCEECGAMFDMRCLDEVFFHCTDHKPRPDIQHAGPGKRWGNQPET